MLLLVLPGGTPTILWCRNAGLCAHPAAAAAHPQELCATDADAHGKYWACLLSVERSTDCVCVCVCTLQVPLSGAVWRISLCLTVPQGIDLPEMGTTSFGHGSVGVVFRGKLLLVVSSSAIRLHLTGINHLFFFLQVKMAHIQGDGGEHVLLLLYDPKTNQTFLPANSRGTVRSALFQAVDTVLKKTYQDHQSGKGFSSLNTRLDQAL